MTRVTWLALIGCLVGACGGERVADAGGTPLDASHDAARHDAASRDAASASDAGSRDAAALTDAAASVDAGDTDAQILDGAATGDGGRDGGDGGPPAPIACDSSTPCPLGECLAGHCFVRSVTTSGVEGMDGIERMIAGVDRDGSLRLLTGVGTQAWEVTGAPSALSVTTRNAASDRDPFYSTGRQGTSRSHHGYTLTAYRWAVIDGVSTINEDRVIVEHHHSFAPDGSLVVITFPQIPESIGTGSRYPLRLWTHDGVSWSFEDITRDAGTRRDHIVRFGRAGEIELVRASAFYLYRWRLDLVAGWQQEVITTFDTAMRSTPAWVNDAGGHTHVVATLDNSGVDDDRVVYVEVGFDGAIEREVLVERRDPPPTVITSSLEIDDAGNAWFLSYGPASGTRRTSYLNRVAPDDSVHRSPLSSLRADTPPQRQALAVSPEGDLYVITYQSIAPTEIMALSLAR